MDDNGNIIYYILLGVIYLLSRVFGKKKKPPAKPARRPQRRPEDAEDRRPVEAPTAEKEPELSFEEILRELSGIPQPKPKADPTPKSPTPSIEAIEPAAEVKPAPEVSPAPPIEGKPQPAYAVDQIDEIASEFKVGKPFSADRLTEPDLAALRRKDLSFTRDDKYSIKKKKQIDYLSLLKEPSGPAKAFVMGEIFNRKYWEAGRRKSACLPQAWKTAAFTSLKRVNRFIITHGKILVRSLSTSCGYLSIYRF